MLKTSKNNWEFLAQRWELGYWAKAFAKSQGNWSHIENSAKIWKALEFPQDIFKDKYVLDVGCGPTGRLAWFDGHKGNGQIQAMDPLLDEYKCYHWAKLSVYDELIPIPAEEFKEELADKFDWVVSLNALDHGYDLKLSLQNIYKYLKKDGNCFISFDCTDDETPDPTHPLRISQKDADKLIRKTGFKINKRDTRTCLNERPNWGHGTHYHWWLTK